MKKLFIKSTNWILAGIIGLFGFAGCQDSEKEMRVEYGVPSADFTVKGAVVNEKDGKPVAGIRVGYSPSEWNEEAFGPKPEYYWETAPFVISNTNGAFTLTAKGYFRDNIATVYLEDIDGEENGLFPPKKVDVDFKGAVQSGKPSGWYGGVYTVTTTIQLVELEIWGFEPQAY